MASPALFHHQCPWGLGSSVTCSALLPTVLFIELAKKSIWVFLDNVTENPNGLFGQLNTSTSL